MRYTGILSLILLAMSSENNTRKIVPKIYHGEDASEGEYPFIGIINSFSALYMSEYAAYYKGGHCGASIVSSRIALTAAHCVVNEHWGSQQILLPVNLQFVAGETDLTKKEGTEQFIPLAGMIVHEDYDSVTFANDIALLITEEEIEFNESVQPISLPKEADMEQLYTEGAPVTVIGWGVTEAGGLSDTLKKLTYVMVSTSTCEDSWGPHYILPGMVCSGEPPMTEEHASSGDSGGPLFTKTESGDWVQVGLVSWGPLNDEKHHTTWDVNSDVGYYRSWISDHIAAAFTEYVTELNAEDEKKLIILTNLRPLLFKTIKILPSNSSKYTTITVKAGNLGATTTVMVHDGSSVTTDKPLIHMTGKISETTITATTSKGLTVAVMTEENAAKSSGLTLEYSQSEIPGKSTKLLCTNGYAACKDRYYCLPTRLFCNSADGYGECRDGSDEVQDYCDTVLGEKNSSAETLRSKEDEKEQNSGTLPIHLSEMLIAFMCTLYLIIINR